MTGDDWKDLRRVARQEPDYEHLDSVTESLLEDDSDELWDGFEQGYGGHYPQVRDTEAVVYRQASPGESAGLASGERFDWSTERGCRQVAVLLLLHADRGGGAPEDVALALAEEIERRAQETGEFWVSSVEVEQGL